MSTRKDSLAQLPIEETDADAQRHIVKVKAEHDEQYRAMRRRAQGLFTALKGQTGIRTPEEMDKVFDKAQTSYETGTFLVERLGASRFLDPELTSVLVRLRNDLLAEIPRLTASDRMHIDMAILSYRNALRIQALVNSALMETERHLFGQLSLEQVLGQTEAQEVARILEDVEQKLLPLLERSQRMMTRALDRLKAYDRSGGKQNVSIGIVGQVNVGHT